MTTDFRALCAELTDAVLSDDSHIDCAEIARRARAALAEPEPPTEGEVAELVDTRYEFSVLDADCVEQAGGSAPSLTQALDEGRHYLASYEQDGPHTLELRRVEVLTSNHFPDAKKMVQPADGEVAEFVAQLRRYAKEDTPFRLVPSMVARAADLLERLPPQPTPLEPTDEEIMGLMPQQMHDDLAAAARALAGTENKRVRGIMRIMLNRHVVDHARAVLARWGRT